jgi:hypothetical protein
MRLAARCREAGAQYSHRVKRRLNATALTSRCLRTCCRLITAADAERALDRNKRRTRSSSTAAIVRDRRPALRSAFGRRSNPYAFVPHMSVGTTLQAAAHRSAKFERTRSSVVQRKLSQGLGLNGVSSACAPNGEHHQGAGADAMVRVVGGAASCDAEWGLSCRSAAGERS